MGEPELEPFLQYVDIIKVDILGMDSEPDRIREVAQKLAQYDCMLLAEKVEDNETFQICLEAGFSLFQGYFFAKPEIIPGKKITSSEITKLQLLKELGNPDFEVGKLARVIQADLSMSYRLFQYINSAGMGVRQKVESIQRAISLLGQRQLAQWLRVIIMSDLSPTKKAGEVAFLSVHRGRFLELSNDAAQKLGISPESMFLLGLFSLLDALLGKPMEEILEHVPLDEEVKAALIGSDDNKMSKLLALLTAYEHADWDTVHTLLTELNLAPENADKHYVQAMNWTQDNLGGEEEVPAA